MEDIEKVRRWLVTFSRWGNQPLHVDHTEAVPENGGLFPAGLEELSHTRDVLGNATVRCRYRFVLHRLVPVGEDGSEGAQWLLDFQNWVREQSARGLAPTFGDEPARERLLAQKGRRIAGKQAGTGVYEVTLTAEFVRHYPNR